MTAKFEVKVLVFAASLRSNSLNDRLATMAARTVESLGGTVDRAIMADFDCPSYDGDDERDGLPEGAKRLRDQLTGSDGFIIVSPEYNASMPGVLKNAIDWTSRFRPQPFTRRYGMLMSASPSMMGGQPRTLVAAHSPRTPRCPRVSRHVFARAGSRGVRQRGSDRERPIAAALR